jgi:hypothetical protein
MLMQHGVFIQANHKQMLGAIVAAYALQRNSRNSNRFSVHIMDYDDIPSTRASSFCVAAASAPGCATICSLLRPAVSCRRS